LFDTLLPPPPCPPAALAFVESKNNAEVKIDIAIDFLLKKSIRTNNILYFL